MENFAVTESQRGARDVDRLKKGKKITHSLRYDRPDGRLSSIILHVVHHLSVSHMIGMTYIYQMLWGKSSGNKRSDPKRKGQQFILVDGNVPCGVQ